MKQNIPPEIKNELAKAPKKPGVYIYRNLDKKVIYVGKAVNLFNRSHSYFNNYHRLDPRIQAMVDEAAGIEYLVVDNEVEALLLEMNLIKKYMPYYNRAGKDDKGYLWVKVYSGMDFPVVRTVREKKEDKADYFGPFPDVRPVRRLLKQLRRVFKYRSDNRTVEIRTDKAGKKYVYTSDDTPCFYCHIGLCSGACRGIVSKADYRSQINELKRFLRSDHQSLKDEYRKLMQKFSQDKNYEKAAEYRDKLHDLEYLTRFTILDDTVDDVSLFVRQKSAAIEGLEELINRLKIDGLDVKNYTNLLNFRIECYDISNIQGSNATSAMVVSLGGTPAKANYRKFKIKTKSTPDDFAMMQETLQRRFKHFDDWGIPDLIVIDGGKGQVSSAQEVMSKLGGKYDVKIPIVGLAKKQEEIFIPETGVDGKLIFRRLLLSKRSNALRIIQQLRDEAHRFGLGYHRLLRSKGMVYSQLDLIPGVGDVTKQALIKAFGSVQGIKKASLEDISTVVKNKATAYKIKKLLV